MHKLSLRNNVVSLFEESKDSYIINHKARIMLSMKYAIQYNIMHDYVLNIGGKFSDLIDKAWRQQFPDVEIKHTSSDLHNRLPYEDNSFSGVLCLEVFEHIGDRNFLSSSKNFEGVFLLLSEMIRVLKEGGRLLITTPNVASLYNAALLLRNSHPFMYPLHYREYTKFEIQTMLEYFKVNIVAFDTNNVFTKDVQFQNEIKEFVKNFSLPVDNRGDDFFIVIEKPVAYQAVALPDRPALTIYPGYHREPIAQPSFFKG